MEIPRVTPYPVNCNLVIQYWSRIILKEPFNPKYVGDYCVVSLKGNQVKVQPSIGGPTEMKHIKHVKYILPANRYIKRIPDYSAFGSKATLRMNPDKIPNLHWQLASTYHTTNVGQLGFQTSNISTHGVNVDTISHALEEINIRVCVEQP